MIRLLSLADLIPKHNKCIKKKKDDSQLTLKELCPYATYKWTIMLLRL